MPQESLEPKLTKSERRELAKHLQDLLTRRPMDMAAMAQGLGVEPEVVVIALRELRAKRRSALRSTIRLGHVAWWWDAKATTTTPAPTIAPDAAEPAEAPAPEEAAEAPPKKVKKAARKRAKAERKEGKAGKARKKKKA